MRKGRAGRAGPPSAEPAWSGCFLLALAGADRNVLDVPLRLGALRQRHGQYAVLERRRNLVAQHFDVERNTTLEGVIGALGIRVTPFLLFLPDRQDVAG